MRMVIILGAYKESTKPQKQSHYIEVAQGNIFYGTENEIWADFEPVGSTEKNTFWPIISNF